MKIKKKEKYKIPKGNLSNYGNEALLTPFPGKNSVSRLAMFKSALTHSVTPANNPDRPLVDSIYSNSLVISSDNYKSKGRVKLLARIPKVVHQEIVETTYIYYDYGLDKVDMEIVPNFERYYKFGYHTKSELENMQIDEESSEEIYTKYTYNMDPDDGAMAYGKNINFIYTASTKVLEDSIVITESLAKRLALNYMDEVEIIYSPENYILKDIYGFSNENGEREYRPFPKIGETVDKEIIFCVSDANENSFLTLDTDVTDSDNVKFVHKGAKVVDITIYSNSKLKNPYLEDLRKSQMEYIRKISMELSKLKMHDYYGNVFTDSLEYKFDRYKALLSNNLRMGSVSLKNKTYIKVKTVNTRPLGPGDKLTNRDGGKGTISSVVPDDHMELSYKLDDESKDPGWNLNSSDEDYVHSYEYGYIKKGDLKKKIHNPNKIDMWINVTGIVNRENPGQLFEKELNALFQFLQMYLRLSNDNTKVKYKNILKWMELAKVPDLLEVARGFRPEDLVNYYCKEDMVLKYDPYDGKMDFRAFHELRKFTSKLNPYTGGCKVVFNGEELSDLHVVGKSFYMVLENGPIKDTSIRADGMTNIKGALSKKGASRKKHQSKWGTTASKISDLGLSIMLNYFKPSDRGLLNNNISILDDYLQGLGINFVQKVRGESNE